MASVSTDPLPNSVDEEFEGARFRITRGDYSPLLKLVSEELRRASVSQAVLLENGSFFEAYSETL
jgi:hypothetical protein